MIDVVEATKEKIVLVCKVLQKQRVIDGYGHLTVRLADVRILSTPHMPPGKVALRDLIVINAEGEKLEGAGEPNGETAMHTSIYKARADVQCILHYHPDEVIAVAAAGEGIKVLSNSGVHFYRGTPIYDSPLLIRTHQLGDLDSHTHAVIVPTGPPETGKTAVLDRIAPLLPLAKPRLRVSPGSRAGPARGVRRADGRRPLPASVVL